MRLNMEMCVSSSDNSEFLGSLGGLRFLDLPSQAQYEQRIRNETKLGRVLRNFPRIVQGSFVDINSWQALSTELVIEEFVEETGLRLAVSEPTQLAFFY